MPLSSSLTKRLRRLRAGYPARAPRHGVRSLDRAHAGPTQIEDPLDAEEFPVLLTAPTRQAMRGHTEPEEAAALQRPVQTGTYRPSPKHGAQA